VGPYGEGKTDDKAFVHKANGRYYLSWGCFYAMADTVYGPYSYKGTVITAASFAPGYDQPTWPHGFLQGRHGSFFEWHNQWYFAYCDISQTGNRYFRDTFVSYVHYRANGEIAPVRVDGVGVGEYRPGLGKIEAEDYFKAQNVAKQEAKEGGFVLRPQAAGGYVVYPNLRGLTNYSSLTLQLAAGGTGKAAIEIREQHSDGPLLAVWDLQSTAAPESPHRVTVPFDARPKQNQLCLRFVGAEAPFVSVDWFALRR
jgi:hypothetical protein